MWSPSVLGGFHVGNERLGKKRISESKGMRYSCRPCLERLHTNPVCAFELKPSFS